MALVYFRQVGIEDGCARVFWTPSQSGKFPEGHEVKYYWRTGWFECSCIGCRAHHKDCHIWHAYVGCRHIRALARVLRDEA